MIDLDLFYQQNPWQRKGKEKVEPLIESLIERDLKEEILNWLFEKEIILIRGARQTGKSTLLKIIINHLLIKEKISPQNIFYFSFDDLDLRKSIQENPKEIFSLINKISKEKEKIYLFLDEVQKAPKILEVLKIFYDSSENYKFFLSGSSSLKIAKEAKESLTGRLIEFQLYPLMPSEIISFRLKDIIPSSFFFPFLKSLFKKEKKDYFKELKNFKDNSSFLEKKLNDLLKEYFLYGGYPKMFLQENEEKKKILLKNIKKRYLEKDILGLIKKEKYDSFIKLIDLLSYQIGNLINYNELSLSAGISFSSLKNFLSLLENTFIISLLSPFSKKEKRSLIKKNPKVYFMDLGFRNISLNFAPMSNYQGSLIENLVFLILKFQEEKIGYQIHFFRTTQETEIDFILKQGKNYIPIEIKFQKIKKPTLPKSLIYFMKENKTPYGLIITQDFLAQRNFNGFKVFFIPLWMMVI